MPQSERDYVPVLIVVALLLTSGAGCTRSIGNGSSHSTAAAPTTQQREYERHVRNLSSRSPEKASAAWKALYDAEMDAFPTLLAHFGDKTLAAPAVSGARLGQITVGYACFEIVQINIEGAWPKSIRDYHLLTPDNTRQWLADHSGLALEELRRAATREALARAQAALAVDPENDYLPGCVRFLKKRDAELSNESD